MRPCLDCGVLVSGTSRCRACSTIERRPRGTQAWARASRMTRERIPYCVACGSTSDLTADHIVPVSRGGRAEVGNLRTLCRACNSAKRDRA